MQVLVTGATGFVGRALLRHLVGLQGVAAIAGLRQVDTLRLSGLGFEPRLLGDLADGQFCPELLQGVDVVVHTAARVHVMQEREDDPLAAFRRVNAAGTIGLAKAAAQAGVKRFVFVSSIKVNGEETFPG